MDGRTALSATLDISAYTHRLKLIGCWTKKHKNFNIKREVQEEIEREGKRQRWYRGERKQRNVHLPAFHLFSWFWMLAEIIPVLGLIPPFATPPKRYLQPYNNRAPVRDTNYYCFRLLRTVLDWKHYLCQAQVFPRNKTIISKKMNKNWAQSSSPGGGKGSMLGEQP